MTTANDIINRALRSLSVIGQGESADQDQAADALVCLNDMVSSWANESLMLYQVSQDSITLTPGKKDYTIGEGAFDINSARPVSIEQAFIRMLGVDYPVTIIDRQRYESIVLKSTTSTFPAWLYYDTGFPSSTLRIWAAPTQANTLVVDSLKPLQSFPALSSAVSLPPGYERALRLNLAVELMPEYRVSNDKIDIMARDAKAGIKRINYTPPHANLGLGGARRYSIYADS
jgi:hypothetical protein